MAVLSMVEINRQFRKRGIQGHCLGLVHDAINYEIRNDHMRKALPIIQDTMEDMSLVERKFGIHVDVPILADVKVGQHWGDAKEISREEVHDWGRAA
jgi:DNA polymerase I-like protein with 3'-5' exonuclease and polymerase domains